MDTINNALARFGGEKYSLRVVSEPKSSKLPIIEKLIGGYFVARFFHAAYVLLYFLNHHLGHLFREFEIPRMVLGCVYLIIGLGLLIRGRWAKYIAIFISGLHALSLPVALIVYAASGVQFPLPENIYARTTVIGTVVIDATITWYLTRSLWRARAALELR